jgi:hypothetical protein
VSRILITGSRTWTDVDAVRAAMMFAQEVHGPGATIVHGACPLGADRQADEIATTEGWPIERHPADWERHGRSAGRIRNVEMIALGADICLAFIRGGSAGATHTAEMATQAGIFVVTHEVPA